MKTMTRALTILSLAAVAGCGGAANRSTTANEDDATITVTAAGATFPAPLYTKWFHDYGLRRNVQINYQPIGSGGGIRQVLAGTVDFGASDMPMTDEQLATASVKILHFPTVLGAVVPTYRVAGVSADLRFTPAALAGIFLGRITKWNDPAIANANPGVHLPDADIVVVHRSDGSGTTFVWTDYLSKVSPEWLEQVGRNTSVNWPVGLGGKGNDGVAALVKQTPNSIGYVELIYAVQNSLGYGAVQNAAGTFVKATVPSVTAAAAAAAASMPADFRVSITNPSGAGAYPICSFTWLLVPVHMRDARRAQAVVTFLNWMLADGQAMAEPLSYAPLPAAVIAQEKQAVSQIRVGS